MIIGITGTLGAGKGTIVEILKEKGFDHYSVRGFLNELLIREGLILNRDNQVELANKLRKENSPSYIVEKLYLISKERSQKAIIESIRTPGEIIALKEKGKFILLAVDADPNIRYKRISFRNTETDDVSFSEFVENEKREWTTNDPNKQNLKECIDLADYLIENNGSLEELREKVLNILEMITAGVSDYKRPSWDEYFMDICKAIAKRATCERGRSGCVIARDKQILVTGYVGSPIGMPHCDDVGHQFKKTIHEDGSVTNHCVRTIHAEQNAICQAAKLGVSIEGATLYCKMTPCSVCAKLIINSGIKRIFCEKKYHAGQESEEMFKKAGVSFEVLLDEFEQYKNQ